MTVKRRLMMRGKPDRGVSLVITLGKVRVVVGSRHS